MRLGPFPSAARTRAYRSALVRLFPVEERVYEPVLGADDLRSERAGLITSDDEYLCLARVAQVGHPRPRVLAIDLRRPLSRERFQISHDTSSGAMSARGWSRIRTRSVSSTASEKIRTNSSSRSRESKASYRECGSPVEAFIDLQPIDLRQLGPEMLTCLDAVERNTHMLKLHDSIPVRAEAERVLQRILMLYIELEPQFRRFSRGCWQTIERCKAAAVVLHLSVLAKG